MTVTANDALNRPITRRNRLRREELQELNIVRRDIDVNKLVIDLVRFKAKKYNLNLRQSVTSAEVELSIDGAHQLTIVVDDAHRSLHRSGALDYALNMKVEGWWWRLVKRSKSGNDITLVFEPLVVAYMRAMKKRLKARRGKITRAEFILRLVVMALKGRRFKVNFFCPELHKKQPIAKSKDRDEQGRHDRREAGLDKDYRIEIDGQEASSAQMENLERVLTVGDKKGARRKVNVAAMMTVLQESRAKTSATNGTHVGLFQQDPRYWPATRDPERDADAFYDRAIALDKKDPRLSPKDLAESIQRSGQGHYYAQWRDEAEDLVDHFNGTVGGSLSFERKLPFEFRVGKKENFYGAALRLAEEVNWRLFTIKQKFYYISEEDLFKSKSLMTIREGKNGVDWIDYDDDERRGVKEVNVTCRMKMWDAPLGSVVTVNDKGPADGKYLVTSLRRSYFSSSGTITMRKPMEEKPEPPNEVKTITLGGGLSSDIGGTARERVVKIAKQSMSIHTGFNRYSQPGALTNDPTPKAPARTDCSQWTRAIYLQAGLPDPGFNTWEQSAKGRRTRRPRPGDLMFPPGVGHVELYVGNEAPKGFNTIGHGSAPIDYGSTAWWPGHYFVTFPFLDAEEDE